MIQNRVFKARRLPFAAGVGVLLFFSAAAFAQNAPRQLLRGHMPAVVSRLVPIGRLPGTNRLSLAIGLPLRNEAELDELLRQLQDPGSTNFHKFLTPAEFAARFGPTEDDYLAVVKFAETNGFTVAATHPNRVVLDVEGSVSNVERSFQVTLRTYRHPAESRDFFAPDTEPSVPTNLSVVTVEGLSDYSLPKPLLHKIDPLKVHALGGSGPSGYYAGNDFRNAYAPGTTLNGAGQSVGLLEFSAYFSADVTSYENTIGLASHVPVNNVVVGRSTPGTANNDEVALDIEVAIAMAPGLSQVIVYETKSVTPGSILSRMATDNLAKQLSCSWTWSGGPNTTIDSTFKQMAAQGQSFFQASGDSDAYTGPQVLGSSSQVDAPVDSTNITAVGGTTLTMNGSGGSWSSEKVWNWNNSGEPNVGSGGGVSTYYKIPYWQANVGMAANSGSTTFRNVPDVALTADQVYVAYNNGSSGGFGGTSCAAPLWAGFCALVNQQSVAAGGTTVGFLNPALYAIASGTNYNACFHDTTAGNNVGTNAPGLFNAVSGYDLCTGLGTPNGTNLINALAPNPKPYFTTQPSSQNVTNGGGIVFSAAVGGQPPFSYGWLFDGTNLPGGGNISGTASNILSITAATTNNAGNYSLVVGNSSGSVTSLVAALNVGFAPAISTQPSGLAILSGSNAVFSSAAGGSTPLAYRWQKNGANIFNGAGISGATSNVLTIAAVTASSGGNYDLFVTNIFGVSTSSVAALAVVLPPALAGPLANQTVECGGGATFTIAAAGTPPLAIQWSLDGAPVLDATNASFSLANVHSPDHTVGVVVTNPYASLASNAVLTVQDTLAPVITLNGDNPLFLELGSAFTDPGATATDACAGAVRVIAGGSVNTNSTGTNTLTYEANDGNGNTNIATRTVIVQDTTPPEISWSFTNLFLAADTNCGAAMPDVTGTNYVLATDLSGALTISQSPTNGSILPLGTNTVVITVADDSGNTAFSTNTIVVLDETPPVILTQPQSRTNTVGTTARFFAAATACTPVSFQWFFNDTALTNETNCLLAIDSVDLTNAGNYSVAAGASGGSVTSAVIALTVDLPPPAFNGLAVVPGGGFNLNLSGTPGHIYVLEVKSDLSSADWLPIATNTLGADGVWQFSDSQATNYQQRFYRIRQLQ